MVGWLGTYTYVWHVTKPQLLLLSTFKTQGIDQEGDEVNDNEDDDDIDMKDATADADADPDVDAGTTDETEIDDLAKQETAEMEEARKERMELIAAEQKKIANANPNQGAATKEEKLNYLLSQSEVFAHFLAGTKSV